MNDFRCAICGKFISYKDMESGAVIEHHEGYVSPCGTELIDDDWFEHKTCSEKYKGELK